MSAVPVQRVVSAAGFVTSLGGGSLSEGVRDAMARHPSNRIAVQGRRIAEKASWKGVEAIQRARANIQRRMDPDVDDISLN